MDDAKRSAVGGPGTTEAGTSQHVSLVVTDRTNGEVVVADAIRWRPVE